MQSKKNRCKIEKFKRRINVGEIIAQFLNRPAPGGRFFPPVDRLFQSGSDDGARFLAAAENPYRLPRSRAAISRLRGMIWCHREAIRAELEICPKRAEFFWSEAYTTLSDLGRVNGEYASGISGLIREALPGSSLDGVQIGERLINEVFVDTHAAFFNERLQQSDQVPVDDRAFYHFDQLNRLIGRCEWSPSQKALFLSPGFALRIASLRSAQKWSAAREVAKQWLDLDSENVSAQAAWIQIISQPALDLQPQDDSIEANAKAAEVLQDAISEMDKLRLKAPYNAGLYQALANLHFVCGIRLAKAGQLARALVHEEKAVMISPGFEDAEKTRTKLIEMMKELRNTVAQLEEQVRQRANTVLNEKGRAMQQEASLGFGLVNQFIQSNEAAELIRLSSAARNRSLWLRVGLSEPGHRWDEQAAALFEGLEKVARAEPKDRSQIATHWKDVAEGDARLATLDAAIVEDFLAHQLLNEPRRTTAPKHAEPLKAEVEPVVLIRHKENNRRDEIPFYCWLHSSKDRGLKWRSAVALSACAAVTMLGWYEIQQRAERDRAFTAFIAAKPAQGREAIIKAAEDFLSAHPFARDPREAAVLNGYEQAFVQWFEGLREVTPADQAVVDRFRRLTTGKI